MVWGDNRSSICQIYGARVTPAGSVLDPSGILISRNTSLYQYYPAVAWGGTRYFVVWGVYSSSPYALYGRFVNTNGTFASDTIRLATGSAGIYHAHAAFDGTNFMVIWVETTSPYVLKGILVSSNGTPITTPFTIATNAYYFKSARVCFDGTQYFVSYINMSSSPYALWGRKYSLSGSPIGSAFKITPTTYSVYYPDVIPGANNRYLNVWSEYRTSGYDIYANLDIQMIGIEEQNDEGTHKCHLKSTIVHKLIELVDTEEEAKILDAQGRYIGITTKRTYDCSELKSGVYFVRLNSGKTFKVIKID